MRARTSSLTELGDLSAPPGSAKWATAVRIEIQCLLKNRASTVQHLRTWCDSFREREGWKSLKNPKGQPFLSWDEFCLTPPPYGLGRPSVKVEEEIERRMLAEKAAAEAAPLLATAKQMAEALPEFGKLGGRGHRNLGRDTTKVKQDRSNSYLARRLKRDRPDIFAKLETYPSVRAAALEAGIVRPSITIPLDPERVATALLRRFDEAQIECLMSALTLGRSLRALLERAEARRLP